MILVLIVIGVILIVAALRNSQGALATALYQDVPPFIKWAAAIVAVGALGFVPGLQKISRYLLALVLLAIFLKNYSKILAGFQQAWQSPPAVSEGSSQSSSGSSGGSSTGSDIQTAAEVAEIAAVL